MNRKTAALSVILAAAMMLQACSFQPKQGTAEETTAATSAGTLAAVNGIYKPGTYTASAQGYGGEVTVTVTVSESKVTDVKIEGANETEGIGSKAVESMPEVILAAQSSKVDAVAGATVTSKAILTALDEALNQAKEKQVEARE